MVALLGPTVAGADSTSGSARPDVFTGVAAATAIHQETNGKSGIGPTSEPFYGSFPDGLSQLSSSGTLARGSTSSEASSVCARLRSFGIPMSIKSPVQTKP